MNAETFVSILSFAERLKDTYRHSYTSKGRRESVAEHSWRLSFMAMLVADHFKDMDISKVIKMCILHDIGEAITGDIPAFEKTASDSVSEAEAVRRWLATLPENICLEWAELFDEMDTLKSPEAKLYKALDKLEALLQHNEADIATWLPLEYDLQLTYGTEECEFDPYIKKIRDRVRVDSLNKIKEIRNGKE